MKDYIIMYKGNKYYISGWFNGMEFNIETIKRDGHDVTEFIRKNFPSLYSDLTTQVLIDYL